MILYNCIINVVPWRIVMSHKILIGVSSCVIGQNVRFDGGHKNNRFVADELANYFSYMPICPEVGMGLPIPRPAIRLTHISEEIRLTETKVPEHDHTQDLLNYSRNKVAELQTLPLCGYVVCAKSPTCGMERVKVYHGNRADKDGIGLYTQHLLTQMPWLPIEEDGRLNDPVLRENFISRVFALQDLLLSIGDQPTAGKIVSFHSRYKLTLMAHHPESYKELGSLVAKIKDYQVNDFYLQYREKLMKALTRIASRKNNTNVLMHIQGYFKRVLDREQKAELATLIDDYRTGLLPLLAPLTLLNHYLTMYSDAYLEQQHYFNPYPRELRLRYGL
jgi:uncharacterized protein YbgA (DUF1722 family)/uncharacterized protein YbbK (DUF523 family)